MTNLEAVRARFARHQGLPFAEVLSEAHILDVLNDHDVKYRERVFDPVTTIWGFLSQVLSETVTPGRRRYLMASTATAMKMSSVITADTSTR